MGIRDTRMMAKALTQRWPITQSQRQEIVDVLLSVARDASNSPRERTSAAKALMSAESQNQIDEHKVVDVNIQYDRARLASIAAELGIDESIVFDAEAQRIAASQQNIDIAE